MEKSYAERADSAEHPSFDPELQFDRDIERYLKEAIDEDPSGQRRESMSPDPLDDQKPF